jgi:uncharacterized protein YkwD
LLFSTIRFRGEVYALMLEVIEQHAYDKSRFLRGANIDDAKIPALSPVVRVQTILQQAAVCAALLAPAAGRADQGGDLAVLINAYRAAPGSCAGRMADAVVPLTLQPELARVQLAPGLLLQHVLERAGYKSRHAQAISISGPPDAKSAMAAIEQKYCRVLLSTEFTALGVVRSGDDWLVILAQPFEPIKLPAWPDAGKAILQAVNAARAVPRTCGDQQFGPAPPVVWNGSLGDAAFEHSREMAHYRYFSHQGKNGDQVGDRARRAGHNWRRIGENIASGVSSPEQAVSGWLASPGHCANIMNPGFTEMGAAYAINGARATGTVYWTQVFGTPR